jgi:putative transposase
MRRTLMYRAYPTPTQGEALHGQLNEACRLYNAALDERRSAWRMNGISLGYHDQANQLKEIRAAGGVGIANFSACQDVLAASTRRSPRFSVG